MRYPKWGMPQWGQKHMTLIHMTCWHEQVDTRSLRLRCLPQVTWACQRKRQRQCQLLNLAEILGKHTNTTTRINSADQECGLETPTSKMSVHRQVKPVRTQRSHNWLKHLSRISRRPSEYKAHAMGLPRKLVEGYEGPLCCVSPLVVRSTSGQWVLATKRSHDIVYGDPLSD